MVVYSTAHADDVRLRKSHVHGDFRRFPDRHMGRVVHVRIQPVKNHYLRVEGAQQDFHFFRHGADVAHVRYALHRHRILRTSLRLRKELRRFSCPQLAPGLRQAFAGAAERPTGTSVVLQRASHKEGVADEGASVRYAKRCDWKTAWGREGLQSLKNLVLQASYQAFYSAVIDPFGGFGNEVWECPAHGGKGVAAQEYRQDRTIAVLEPAQVVEPAESVHVPMGDNDAVYARYPQPREPSHCILAEGLARVNLDKRWAVSAIVVVPQHKGRVSTIVRVLFRGQPAAAIAHRAVALRVHEATSQGHCRAAAGSQEHHPRLAVVICETDQFASGFIRDVLASSLPFGICNARAFRVRLSRARPPAQAQVNAAVRGLANCHNSPGILLRDRAVCGIKLPRDVLLATCRCRLGSAPADGF
eukprot:scaffold7340_cov266-Pinguiococcus_pyrenoidosus.AAC.91